MPRICRLSFAVLFVLTLIAACGSESTPASTPSPSAEQTEQPPSLTPTDTAMPAALAPTQAPTMTASPTAASQPTRTPYVLPGPGEGTQQVPENYVLPGDWLNAPFTADEGLEYVFEDFIGRGVIVQIVSTSCDQCLEQHRFLLEAIQDRLDLDLLPDTVFILLSVSQQETPHLIRTVFQNELGPVWDTVDLLDDPDIPADWIAAVASPDLLTALERSFGPHIKTASAVTTIIIQPDGLAHQMTGTLISPNTLRDAISAYGNPLIR